MCQVSNKSKLCTCNVPNIYCHYWHLYRWVKGKADYVIGEIMLPFKMDEPTHQINIKTLLSLLNEGNVFDPGIVPEERDLLVLSFYLPVNFSEYLDYGFSYRRKQWRPKEYHALMWQWHHEVFKKGIIKNAV